MTTTDPIGELKKLPELAKDILKESRDGYYYWGELLTKTSTKKPDFHQAKACFEVIKRGNDRLLVEYATGSGKTYFPFLIKAELEETLGRKARMIVFSPEQALRTAWSEEELDSYSDSLGIGKQKRVLLNGKRSVSDIRGYDLLGLNYHKLGYLDPGKTSNNPYVTFLEDLFKNPDFRPDIIALDEVQNLKAPRSNRTQWLEVLQSAVNGFDTKWILLSAYPVPNKLEDAGVPLHILDPNYPLEKFSYKANPHAIRDMRLQGKWLTFTREQLRTLFNLPELTEGVIPVEMDEEHAKRYLELWKNGDMHLGKKLLGLRRVAIDSTYGGLREYLGEAFSQDRNAQAIIFSDLKTGIFDKLYESLSPVAPKGVQIVDGDMSFQERVEAARNFREGRVSVQINTDVMGEGIPLNVENICYAIHIEPPSFPGGYHQDLGRVYRRNQKAPVHSREVVATSSKLKEMMEAAKPELEATYHVRFPASWTPTTIPEDERNIRLSKEKIYNDKVRVGLQISDLEENLMNTDSGNITTPEHSVHFASLPPISPQQVMKSVMAGFSKQTSLYGLGDKELQEAADGKGSYAEAQRALVSSYSTPEAFLPQARIANLVSRVVKSLEQSSGRKFERILDVGCGSGTICYALQRPVVNLDVDPNMLGIAKQLLHDIEGANYVQGSVRKLPFSKDSFELVTASNSLMYLAQRPDDKEYRRELEESILEVNRVLQKGGPLIVTLPHKQTTTKMFDDFNRELEEYGFAIKDADFYIVYADELRKIPIQKTYMTVAEKSYNASALTPEPSLIMYMPTDYMVVGGTGRYLLRDISPRAAIDNGKLTVVGKQNGLARF